ncbi:MAG: DUF881 domain-containing protein [Actinomycetota bacterium]|nr:DUF881 domain-containing protein [Actinomycetota bacterium]
MPSQRKPKETLIHLRNESIRRIVQSEKAVERRFHEARLMMSLAVGVLLVGFLLVAQWKGNATVSTQLDRQSDQSLAIIVQQLTTENVALRGEVMRLQLRILEAERQTKDRGEVLNEAAKELNAIRVMSGLEPASGPGVTIRIEDPDSVLLPQDFVALIHELRAGGAEAIAVNGRRVSATTGFSATDGHLTLGTTALKRGYVIQAIGEPTALQQSLTLPGGLKSTLSAFPGVTVEIDLADELELAAAQDPGLTLGRPVEGD